MRSGSCPVAWCGWRRVTAFTGRSRADQLATAKTHRSGDFVGGDGSAAVEKHAHGSGMIVSFERGKGEIFCAGTREWINGGDFYVKTVTCNVLDGF